LLGATYYLVLGDLFWGKPFIRKKGNMGFIKDSFKTLEST
jgi:hypothetical protein